MVEDVTNRVCYVVTRDELGVEVHLSRHVWESSVSSIVALYPVASVIAGVVSFGSASFLFEQGHRYWRRNYFWTIASFGGGLHFKHTAMIPPCALI